MHFQNLILRFLNEKSKRIIENAYQLKVKTEGFVQNEAFRKNALIESYLLAKTCVLTIFFPAI